MIPKYKTGDVVRYTDVRVRGIEPRLMIILEVKAILTQTVRYKVLIGDEQQDDIYEHWIEPVQDH